MAIAVRLLTVIAVVLVAAALRAAYPVAMPVAAALIIVAAIWPISELLRRFLPTWLAYAGTVLALVVVAAAFVGAVWFSANQVVDAFARNEVKLNAIYDSLVAWQQEYGIRAAGGEQIYAEFLALAQALLTNIYTILVYIGFILLLVILALPEVPVLRRKLHEAMSRHERHEVARAIGEIAVKVRRYIGTTFLTSLLTGAVSAAWSLIVGLELALVWGVLNFLLNFIPLVGNIVGSLPPALYAVVQFQNATMPLVVLLAFWSWMWGVAGALFAVPLTAALAIVADHFPTTRWLARLLAR